MEHKVINAIKQLSWVLLAASAFGTLLGMVRNANSFITDPIRNYGTSSIVIVLAILLVYVWRRPRYTVELDGNQVRIRRFPARTWFAIIGIGFVLWVPTIYRNLTTSSDDGATATTSGPIWA